MRVLATPAWRGADRLAELLQQWCAATTPATSACLYLLADPRVDGAQQELERACWPPAVTSKPPPTSRS